MSLTDVEKFREILLRYTCQVCSRVFTTLANLKRHNQLYTSSHFIYPCCGEAFSWTKDCLTHSCALSTDQKSNGSLQDVLETSGDNLLDDALSVESLPIEDHLIFKCNDCHAKFSRYQSVKNHILKYPGKHDYSCIKCKKHFFTNPALSKHLCILKNFKFLCSCGSRFESFKKFKAHIGNKRPYYCCSCNQKSASFNNLVNHIRSHTKENTYNCNICKKSFRVRESLTIHLKLHEGVKPFHCSKCSYSTFRKWNLQLHEKKHNPERNTERRYLCAVCGSCFFLKHHLKRHTAIHNDESSHLCLICGKLFAQSAYLEKHLINHRKDSDIGYKCAVCQTEVIKNDLYRHHLETGHFQHVCHPCQKIFITKFNLQRHIRNHSKVNLVA